jgi:2',3'-cyclic-nucleotide 2'-phosphodiesterase (5'-nucleotidase family)
MSKILWLFVISVLLAGTTEGKNITILYTNSTNGDLDMCKCPGERKGGFPRRAALIKELRAKYQNIILLDAGDLFPIFERKNNEQYAVKAMNNMGYDAMCVGDQEFLRGQDFLDRIKNEAQFPFISATLFNAATDKPLFEPFILKELDGIRVGVLGLTGKNSFMSFKNELIAGIKIIPIQDAVKKYLPAIREKVDIVIALTHQSDDMDRELAQTANGIDVIVGGHSQTIINEPVRVNNTIIVQAGENGYYLGILELTIDDQKKISGYENKVIKINESIAEDEQMRALIDEYLAQKDEKAAPAAKETKKAIAPVVGIGDVRKYTVGSDETLQDIAGKPEIYGNPDLWKKIYEANKDRISNPDIIFPGQELTIPK